MKGILIILVSLLFLLNWNSAFAQRLDKAKDKLEAYRSENWPPKKAHYRHTLGYVLQGKFKKHTEFCGFAISGKRRDYVPNDLTKFLGKRNLRTRVETADIRGGSLLSYIFNESEIKYKFDDIKYSPTRIFRMKSIPDQFVVNPEGDFDSFILTKNCSGYLKAALDAGVEPPYSAFAAALSTDDRRESSIVALSGSFISPLHIALEANNKQTIEALLSLWRFYRENPSYINQAYYLREFQGVMIRHVSTSEENVLIEREVGININLPLAAHLQANLGITNTAQTTFSGTDWETIIFADFEDNYQKERLFTPLPSPSFIRSYFENIQPTYEKSRDFPLMTEGVEHRHFLIIEGIPEHMTQNYWVIDNVSQGVYEDMPSLYAEYFNNENGSSGCRFTITGQPSRANFRGPNAYRPSKVPLNYQIRSREPVGGEYLVFNLQQEIQTSSHPIAAIIDGEFDLSKKEDRKFAFQWKFLVEIEDKDSPVNFSDKPFIENLIVRKSNQTLNVTITDIRALPDRGQYEVTLETQETFSLDKIDDSNMLAFNLTLDVHLPMERTSSRSVRPLKGILNFPSIKKEKPTERINILEPQPGVPRGGK